MSTFTLKKTQTIFFLLFMPILVVAQAEVIKLFEPVSFQQAVELGTRTRDGKPGPNYWQNHAHYDIEVRLDTAENRIVGKETVTYFNESPDSIPQLVVRLYQNRNQKDAIRNRPVHPGNIHEGIILDTITINGQGVVAEAPFAMFNGTNVALPIPTPLAPGDSLTFYCEWNYAIPLVPSSRRTGYYKNQAYFIGYFYPQIAVYDDLEQSIGARGLMKGWDFSLFHQGMQEFYNDMNDYRVQIHVPKNFFVWATGDNMNFKEIFPEPMLTRFYQARDSHEKVAIVSKEHLGKVALLDSVWIFEADGVPDFAFGIAADYIWEGCTRAIGGELIFIDVAYPPSSEIYQNLLDVAVKSVEFASEVFPGIPYPYKHATTFNGNHSGGMEFPMIANNEASSDTIFLKMITTHEIIHNYFPFMTGMNEKKYPFMDEGWTQLASEKFMKEVYGIDFYKDGNFSPLQMSSYQLHSLFASLEDDIPMIQAFAHLDEGNFFYQCLLKPVTANQFFIDMVGEDVFLEAFHAFINRWRGKHPTPYDYFYAMNDLLGENYNWYWKAWYFDQAYPDLGLELDGNDLVVERVGEGALPLPVNIIVEKQDGSTDVITRSAGIWKSGAKKVKIPLHHLDEIASLRIDLEKTPDINPINNELILSERAMIEKDDKE